MLVGSVQGTHNRSPSNIAEHLTYLTPNPRLESFLGPSGPQGDPEKVWRGAHRNFREKVRPQFQGKCVIFS